MGPFSLPDAASILSPRPYIGKESVFHEATGHRRWWLTMPRRPNIPCKHPGCGRLIPYGGMYCEEHRPLHAHDRKTTTEKGYGRRWQKARAAFLHAHPLCARCQAEGRLVKATVVDHIVPHRGDSTLFWDTDNWQALCKRCHDHKTMTEDRYQEFRY